MNGLTLNTPSPRILIFLPHLLMGGAELHALSLYDFLKAQGFPCKLLIFGARYTPSLRLRVRDEDIEFLNLSGMSQLKAWPKTWRALHSSRADLIICINQGPLIISVVEKLGLATGAKLACIFHTTRMQSFEAKQEKMLRWVAPMTDLLVYLSPAHQAYWQARGIAPRRATVIPNGVDLNRLGLSVEARAALRAELGFAEGDVVLCVLARFRPEKNHAELVRAVAHLKQQAIVTKVLCVGAGHTLSPTIVLTEALGVRDQFVFLGEKSDVAPLIAACDVGILCSSMETFPLAALEILGSGLPMVASNIEGNLTVIKEGINGLLYTLGDVGGFAAAIQKMLDAELRVKLAAQARASVSEYSLQRMCEHYLAEFERLWHAPPPKAEMS